MIVHMTVSEHIEQNSFCYDPQFPPDVAEGLPLISARRTRRPEAPPMKRALQSCVRMAHVVSRKK
jgi:hypothetical protein